MVKEKNSSCQKDYIEEGISPEIYKPKSDATVFGGNEAMFQNDSVKSPNDTIKKAQEEIKAHQMPSL